MKPSELKHYYLLNNPEGKFFTRETMRFFGDTMKNYGVKTHTEYYELYRKQPVKSGVNASAYFEKVTFKRLYNVDK